MNRRGWLKLLGLAPAVPIAAALPALPSARVLAHGAWAASIKWSDYEAIGVERELGGVPVVLQMEDDYSIYDKAMRRIVQEHFDSKTQSAISDDGVDQPYWGA